jgi:RNA polymerase sigma-70 factor (sigma-E family)
MDGSVDFEAFCLRHHTALLRLLTLYCGDRELARDLTQETLARVWLHWRKVGRMDRPDLWAKRVALNLANSHFRRRRVERSRRHLLVEGPTESSSDAGSRIFVEQVLSGLTARQRTAVLLRFLEDLSVEQTSELMGCSQGTVKKLTARALVELRATVGAEIEVDTDA